MAFAAVILAQPDLRIAIAHANYPLLASNMGGVRRLESVGELLLPAMKTQTRVSLIVRIEKISTTGKCLSVWERSVSDHGQLPDHLMQSELLHLAHAQLHPPKAEPPHRHE